MIERKLTIKQQNFADAYIELGNVTQDYLKAYPNVKKERKATASPLLTNVNVSSYIEERLKLLKSERVAKGHLKPCYHSLIPIHTLAPTSPKLMLFYALKLHE